MSEHRRLLKSTSTISTLTIISRIFGYFREQRIAFLLGTGDIADAYLTAYRIPNLFRRLVGEGAVSAAFIPTFSRYVLEEGRKEAFEFVHALLSALTAFLAAITVLGIVFSPLIVHLIAPGYAQYPGKLESMVLLNRVLFPYLAFVSLSAVAMGILNSFHKFAAPAFAPIMLNLSVIAFSFVAGWFSEPALALAAGVVAGGILQVAIQIPSLRRVGFRFRWAWNLTHPGVRRVAKLIGPLLFGVGIVQVNVYVDTFFATYMGEGAMASINFADRIMELVLGGYAIALSTAILPSLSQQASEFDLVKMRATLNFALRLILFVTLPASVGLVLLRIPIVEVLFEHGQFDMQSTSLTAWPLLFFALGLPAFSTMKIIVPAFYALHDTRTPVAVAFAAMILNIVLNLLFFRWLDNGGPPLATSVSAVFSSVLLVGIFRGRQGSLGIRNIAVSVAKFSAASAVMGLVAYFAIHLPGFYEGRGVQKSAALAVTILAATGTYFGMAYVLKAREIVEMGGMFSSRRASAGDPGSGGA